MGAARSGPGRRHRPNLGHRYFVSGVWRRSMVSGWNRHLPSPLRVLLDDFELTSRAAPRARVALPISSDPVVGLSSLSPASCRVRPKKSFGTALQFLAATGSAPNARSRRGIRGRARRPATSLPSPEPVPSPLSSFDPLRGFAAGGKNGPPAQSARSSATPAATFYCSVTLRGAPSVRLRPRCGSSLPSVGPLVSAAASCGCRLEPSADAVPSAQPAARWRVASMQLRCFDTSVYGQFPV